MGPSWVLSTADGPHEPCYQGSYQTLKWTTYDGPYCAVFLFVNFIHILQGYLNGTEGIILFPQCMWRNLNLMRPRDAYMHHQARQSLFQMMACHLFGVKPLSKQCWIIVNGPFGIYFSVIWIKIQQFSLKKIHLKIHPENVGHLVSASMW